MDLEKGVTLPDGAFLTITTDRWTLVSAHGVRWSSACDSPEAGLLVAMSLYISQSALAWSTGTLAEDGSFVRHVT